MEDTRLQGKIALVSGASRGLGRAVARELTAAGAHVVATGRSRRGSATQTDVDDLTLDRTVELVGEAGGSAEAMTCDHTPSRRCYLPVERVWPHTESSSAAAE